MEAEEKEKKVREGRRENGGVELAAGDAEMGLVGWKGLDVLQGARERILETGRQTSRPNNDDGWHRGTGRVVPQACLACPGLHGALGGFNRGRDWGKRRQLKL